MKSKGKITSEKKTIQDIFSDFWFRIPEYQRNYVWTDDEINELLTDIEFAWSNNSESDYFLGSLVLQAKEKTEKNPKGEQITFTEFDVLDGQQRLTTLFIILAVVRDLTKDVKLKKAASDAIFQEENRFKKIPERIRLDYKIRENVVSFIENYVKKEMATEAVEDLKTIADEKNISKSNMANAILCVRKYFEAKDDKHISDYAQYLFNNVLLIYVATEELEDAFRLFTILNSRGIPLTNSDILKSINLGEIKDIKSQEKYGKEWESIEEDLGTEELDRFLSYLRTILVKEKARKSILEEFEENVYKQNKLKKGEDTLKFITNYKKVYDSTIYFEDLPASIDNQYKNLVTIMWLGFPSTEWIPPLMMYYNKFRDIKLLEFLTLLDNKFSADWLMYETPTNRINNMNNILKKIELTAKKNIDTLFNEKTLWKFDSKKLKEVFESDIYGKRFAKYLLLKLEYFAINKKTQFNNFNIISIEHVLPQTPDPKSQWMKDFTADQHEEYLNKIGNLVLISRKKNSQLSNSDFTIKKKKYFKKFIDTFPNSLTVISESKWTPIELKKRQKNLVDQLVVHYKH